MTAAPIDAFVALGANLGDPRRQLLAALEELAALPATRLAGRSPLYRSAPLGGLDQPDYVNAVARLATRLTPRELLEQCLAIETRHGRQRAYKNAPRTLDLDLLLYDGLVMHEAGLTLPHPRMHERAFVLRPLADLAPDADIPGRGRVAVLLAGLDGGDLARLPDPPRQAIAP